MTLAQLVHRLYSAESERGQSAELQTETVLSSLHLEREQGIWLMGGNHKIEKRREGVKKKELKELEVHPFKKKGG